MWHSPFYECIYSGIIIRPIFKGKAEEIIVFQQILVQRIEVCFYLKEGVKSISSTSLKRAGAQQCVAAVAPINVVQI